ncbi:MAG: OmpA family protein, partial [Pseudomonadota bacterium]
WWTFGLASLLITLLVGASTLYLAAVQSFETSLVQRLTTDAPRLMSSLTAFGSTTLASVKSTEPEETTSTVDATEAEQATTSETAGDRPARANVAKTQVGSQTATPKVDYTGLQDAPVARGLDVSTPTPTIETGGSPKTAVTTVQSGSLDLKNVAGVQIAATPNDGLPQEVFRKFAPGYPGYEVFEAEAEPQKVERQTAALSVSKQPRNDLTQSCRTEVERLARSSTVWFPIGVADVPDQGTQRLATFAEKLAACDGVQIEVGGHTDRLGADGQNFTLSWRRAEAVAGLLTQNGISQERMIVVGFGPRRPLAEPGSSPIKDAASVNRRVELIVR